MPARQRVLLAAAALAGAALLAAGPIAIALGHRRAGAALLVAAVIAGAAVLQACWVRFDLSGASLRRGRGDRREVALTFDDGPSDDTPAVLDALDAAGARASFFVLGEKALERPDLVREVARRGHLVALHGHSHRKLHLCVPQAVAEEIDRGREAIRAAGVEPAPFFRAPHGFKGPLLQRALRRRGLTLVGWTRGVWDTERPGAAAIVERACARRRGGEILLLHDGCGTPGLDPRRDQTAAAVPELVRRWREDGFDFVTVDVLAAARPAPGGGRTARLVGLVALAVLVFLAARNLDPAELRRAFADARPTFLLAAMAANLLALAMQAGRWLAIVHPIEPRARPRDAFFTLVAGYAVGLLVPARASDLARAHLMARRSGASMATLAATAVVDHLLGSVALFGVLGLMATFSGLPLWLRSAGTAAFAAAGGALLALWLLRLPEDAPRGQGHGLRAVVQRLRHGLVAVGRPRALLLSWSFALGGWAAEGLIAWCSLRAFGLPGTMEMALLVVIATTLSSAASISPGNAGAFELACVLALSGFGVGREPALAFALGYHAVHLVPVALLGGGWLLAHGYRGSLAREPS
ncbi:MAG TPA: lysylphosphatidylglycerol synthase domain-containing protein [Anaeromyxobacteraceae bacterium]